VLFFPLGDPAGHSADGEHDGEHVYRQADGFHDDAAVEIDIGVEFAFDEIGVFLREVFEFAGDVEEGIGHFELGQNFFRGLF
jgi:hypothetical protein